MVTYFQANPPCSLDTKLGKLLKFGETLSLQSRGRFDGSGFVADLIRTHNIISAMESQALTLRTCADQYALSKHANAIIREAWGGEMLSDSDMSRLLHNSVDKLINMDLAIMHADEVNLLIGALKQVKHWNSKFDSQINVIRSFLVALHDIKRAFVYASILKISEFKGGSDVAGEAGPL